MRYVVAGLLVLVLLIGAGLCFNVHFLVLSHITTINRAKWLYAVYKPDARTEDAIFATIPASRHAELLELMLTSPRAKSRDIQPVSHILLKLNAPDSYGRSDLIPHAIGILRKNSEHDKELFDMITGRTGATNPELASLLLGHGVSPNMRDGQLPALLHSLSGKVPTEYTMLLLRAGADPNAANQYGETALTIAVREGDPDFLRLLMEYGGSVEVVDNEGLTLLHHAALEGRPECVPELLTRGLEVDARDEDGVTPLMYAMHGGGAQMLRLLQRYALMPNLRAPGGLTPLHLALNSDFALPNTGRYLKHSTPSPELASMLLTAGAQPLAVDKRGWSPVHYALTSMRFLSYRETVDRIETLLRAGADPTLRCDAGLTPLGQVKAAAPNARYIPEDIAEAFERVGYPLEHLW